MDIARVPLLEAVQGIIKPRKGTNTTYALIAESHGVGKTTAVLTAASRIGKGIIYADVPPEVEAQFAEAS